MGGDCDNAGNILSDSESEHSTIEHSSSDPDSSESEDESDSGGPDGKTWQSWRQQKRHQKRRATLKDPLSTGRKEAARLYPLDPNKPCEWLGQNNKGGGNFPINGCPVEDECKQVNRHHGPDKNTLNNEEDNVHRIGFKCHNRWHAKNDANYVPGDLLSD